MQLVSAIGHPALPDAGVGRSAQTRHSAGGQINQHSTAVLAASKAYISLADDVG
jgi:hypothetical protein